MYIKNRYYKEYNLCLIQFETKITNYIYIEAHIRLIN